MRSQTTGEASLRPRALSFPPGTQSLCEQSNTVTSVAFVDSPQIPIGGFRGDSAMLQNVNLAKTESQKNHWSHPVFDRYAGGERTDFTQSLQTEREAYDVRNSNGLQMHSGIVDRLLDAAVHLGSGCHDAQWRLTRKCSQLRTASNRWISAGLWNGWCVGRERHVR